MNNKPLDKNPAHILTHPVFIGLENNGRVIRAQLFFFSVIALIISYFELKVNEQSSILGVKFDNLQEWHVQLVLAVLISYLLFHFFLVSIEAIMEFRLRLSGSSITDWGSEHLSVEKKRFQ